MASATELDPAKFRHFPRGPLVAAGSLVLLTIVTCGLASLTGFGRAGMPIATVVETRSLTFTDRADGAVAVNDARDGHVVAIVAPGTGGFVRGVMRGLARDRHRSSLSDSAPFTLTLWADGRLSLTDTTTGRRIDLEAFGETNLAAFAVLLRDQGAAS